MTLDSHSRVTAAFLFLRNFHWGNCGKRVSELFPISLARLVDISYEFNPCFTSFLSSLGDNSYILEQQHEGALARARNAKWNSEVVTARSHKRYHRRRPDGTEWEDSLTLLPQLSCYRPCLLTRKLDRWQFQTFPSIQDNSSLFFFTLLCRSFSSWYSTS